MRYALRSKKELSKAVLYEVRFEVENTVQHDCVLWDVHTEVEDTVERDCVLCEVHAEVEERFE